MKRISLSLPDDIYYLLEHARKSGKLKRSHVVVQALKEYFARHGEIVVKAGMRQYPTVLWKLKLMGGMALRSPKLTEKRIRGQWIVEEY